MHASRKEAAWILAVCAAAVLMKVVLLLTSQSAVDSDEAIVGLMALHIHQGISHPLFFYGQSYDAGAGLFAHATAVAFAAGGVSGLILKLVALAVWLGMVLLAGYILRQWIGWRAAGYGMALILWAPTSVEWAMKARGGYMLSVIFSLLTIGAALCIRPGESHKKAQKAQKNSAGAAGGRSLTRNLATALTVGACGAAAVWSQPTALPLVSLITVWVIVESLLERNFLQPALIVAGALIVSIAPVAVVSTSGSSWSWQAFAGADTGRDPSLLFTSILPAFFTPELDGVYPPAPLWVRTVGYLWLIAVVAACALAIRDRFRGISPNHLRRPSALVLVSIGMAPLAFFMAGSYYARPRHILALYPIACILIAAVAELWRERTAQAWPSLVIGVLLVSGAAVHVNSVGPPAIHGAGEQEWRQPASLVDEITADLDRHQVQCVFSESPMLQWNLMFASNERIAARWITAEDRWPPYVERVNRAFAAGERCAVLIVNAPGSDRITGLRAHFGEKSENVTVFNERYALLYQVPSNITDVFR